MMIFDPLWETMKRKNVTCYKLINTYKVSRSMIDKLKHNRNVTLETVDNLCQILDCRVEDVVLFVKNDATADGSGDADN